MYNETAQEICSSIRQNQKISAIKIMRQVTFDGLKDCKAIIDRIADNIDSVKPSDIAGYMSIRRMTNFHAVFGQFRTYNRDSATDRMIAIEHLGMVMSSIKAEGVMEGIIKTMQASNSFACHIAVYEDMSYHIKVT